MKTHTMHIWNFSNFRQLDNVTRLPTGTTDLNMEFVIAYSPCDVCDKVIGKNVPFKNHRTVNHDFELFQFQTWQCYKIVHKDKRSNMEHDICLIAVSTMFFTDELENPTNAGESCDICVNEMNLNGTIYKPHLKSREHMYLSFDWLRPANYYT